MGARESMMPPVASAQAANVGAAGPRRLLPIGLLLLSACQTVPAAPSAAPAAPTAAARGRAFAQARCSSCHETGLYGTSSNPNAPPFGAIANHEGVSGETLTYWLRGAHNYPIEMDFYLHEEEVDALVAYFLSLKVRDYRRPADL